ncbi:MAG: hypothetical protein ACI4EX_12375 [Lachnospiraceae bacterium]
MKYLLTLIFGICFICMTSCGKSNISDPISEESAIITEDLVTSESTFLDETISESSPNRTLADYHFETGEYDGYNAILDINGYQYRFNLSMETQKAELIIAPETEKDHYGSMVKVFPVLVSDSTKTEELGYIFGYEFSVTSPDFVLPQYNKDGKICGQILTCEGGKISIRTAKEVDKDTYVEFVDFSENETVYEIIDDVEYIMLDGNFVSTPVTYERFKEHLNRNPDKVYYLFEDNGKIYRIIEPYIP